MADKKPVRAVLFDLDNTLVDFMGMKRRASLAAARAMVESGLDGDADALGKDLFDFYLGYFIESDDAFEKYLKERHNVESPRILAAGINAYLREKYLTLRPFPGVVELLSELKKRGLKLAVVSDGVRLKAWMRLNEAGLDRFFDVVVTHEDTCKKKPCPEPFQKALDALKVGAEDCLFVGDWPDRDVAGAKALGMRTVLARYGHVIGDREKHVADYEIDDPKEIFSLL